MTPATTVRLANLARVLQEMRDAQALSRSDVALSRSDVARLADVSVATAHRLISDLAELGLVEEQPVASGAVGPGRPPVVYRFRDEAALLAAADVGNETTRLAVTTLSGRVLASACLPSDGLGRELASTLAGRIAEMVSQVQPSGGQLAGAGIGIASAVDADGVLRAPPIHKQWDGLPLRASLATRLGCRVTVAQDDHLSPIAESSEEGTFPGTSSLLVLEIGRGIGVGMTLGGEPVAGARHRFGRIAGWPVSGAAGPPGPESGSESGSGPRPGRTLGECLAVGGLVSQYQAAGGSRDVRDGAALAAAARSGDEVAAAVFLWAAREVADLVGRLHLLCDPEAVVIGGGLARSYDLLEPGLSALPGGLRVARSVLGEQAVVAGAVLVARSLAQSWLGERLART